MEIIKIGDSESHMGTQEEKPPVHMPVFDASRYVTFSQGVLGIVATLIAFSMMGFGYVSGVQAKIDLESQRSSKLEYQAQISIDDRRDIHMRLDHFESAVGEINQRLARIDTKLDEIKARQGLR